MGAKHLRNTCVRNTSVGWHVSLDPDWDPEAGRQGGLGACILGGEDRLALLD